MVWSLIFSPHCLKASCFNEISSLGNHISPRPLERTLRPLEQHIAIKNKKELLAIVMLTSWERIVGVAKVHIVWGVFAVFLLFQYIM